jgi:ABC-2 type transport system permease protein
LGFVIAEGIAFGLLLLNTPAAIVSYYIVPPIWTLAAPLQGAAQWLDPVQTLNPFFKGSADAGDWARFGTSTALWIALPLLIGIWRVLRHETR